MKPILIVDDDPGIRALYKRFLAEEGYTVFEAPSAAVACRVLKDTPVDLVLLDIKMKDIDGAAAFEIIRRRSYGIKVIVCSILPMEMQKLLIAEASAYFEKFKGVEVLLTMVGSVLDCGGWTGEERVNKALLCSD